MKDATTFLWFWFYSWSKGFCGSPFPFELLTFLVIIAKKINLKIFKPSPVPAIIWLITSTVLLTLPGTAFPKENWLDKIWFDKWVHIGLFCVLVFLLCWGLLKFHTDRDKLKRLSVIFALDCLVFGIVMEFIQDNFIPHRSFDFGDIVADAAGCLAGWWLITRYYRKYIKK